MIELNNVRMEARDGVLKFIAFDTPEGTFMLELVGIERAQLDQIMTAELPYGQNLKLTVVYKVRRGVLQMKQESNGTNGYEEAGQLLTGGQ